MFVASSFTTYRAMLAYLHTFLVPFTALSTDYLVARDKALPLPPNIKSLDQTPQEWLRFKFDHLEKQRDWLGILPCSPSAMYRLADCYQMEKLRALTEARILRCLTVENVRLLPNSSELSRTP